MAAFSVSQTCPSWSDIENNGILNIRVGLMSIFIMALFNTGRGVSALPSQFADENPASKIFYTNQMIYYANGNTFLQPYRSENIM